MSTQVSSATVAVFPTFKGFRAAIASETRTAGQSGGKAFDSAFKAATANTAANVTKGLEAQVKAATQALSKARLAEADALGRTRTAQAAYNESLTKYGAESARAIAAEERLASARRKSDEATAKVAAESNRLKAAQSQLADATTKAGAAGEKGANQFVRGWQAVKGKLAGILKPAVDDASKKAAAAADDGGRKAGSGFVAGFKGALGGLAVLGAGSAMAGFFRDANAEAVESQKVNAITANALKQTGAAAWTSAEQIGDLATAISSKTGIDDEAIQSSANLLLTFKNVRNEVGAGANIFDRATAAAQDLAAAGFGDAEGASKMLGKALNDPIKGISALGRAGVTFTAQQKAQIKAMVASGDVLGAQKIIMREVESQVGGAAAASATAAEKLATKWGNFKESIGAALLPVVDATANGLGKLLDIVGPKLVGVVERASSAILGLSALFARGDFTADLGKAFGIEEDSPIVGVLLRVRDGITGIFTAVGPLLASVNPLGMLVKTFVGMAPAFSTAMQTGQGFGAVFSTFIEKLATGAAGMLTTIAGLLTRLIPTVVPVIVSALPTLVGAFTTLINALAGVIPTLLPALVQVATTLLMGVVQAVPLILPPLVTALLGLIQAIVGMLPTLIPVLVQVGVSLFMALVNAIPLILPPLIAGIMTLIQALVELLPTLTPMLLQAAVALLTAISDAIPVILPVLLDNAIALIMAVVTMLPTLIPALLDAAVKLLTAIINAIPVILPKLITAAVALIGAVLSLLPTLAPKLLAAAVALFTAMVNAVPKIQAALTGAIGSLIQGGINEIGKWTSKMLSSGQALIGGFVDGIKRGFTSAVSAVQDGLSKVRSFFPFSPAKRGPFSGAGYTDRSGLALMGDFAGGIADAGAQAVDATARVMGRVQGQFQGLSGAALGSGATTVLAGGAASGGSALTRADLDGMVFHFDLDGGRGWFTRQLADARRSDLIASRAL